jgi:hypothetical protein
MTPEQVLAEIDARAAELATLAERVQELAAQLRAQVLDDETIPF